MIHHLGVFASEFAARRAFFRSALQPLAIVVGHEADDVCEFWHSERETPSLSLHPARDEVTRGLHLAFEAKGCAFVDDPDGNNIEAVHKEP